MGRALSRREWLGATGVAAAAVVAACGSTDTSPTSTTTITVPANAQIPTEYARPSISNPDEALAQLMQGNARFVDAKMVHPAQDPEHRLRVSQGQQPFATILTCSDSRLPPEVIFDQGLGDLFVVRVAGNIVDAALTGSVEYAVDHLNTPLVVVIGHQRCGAVEATLESIQHNSKPHGDIGALVSAITPAIPVAEQRPGDLLENTVRVNAEMSRDALAKSPELAGRIKSGEVKTLAAYYSLDDGRIALL
jgi:carbonic anhydrase